jgi:septum formation protein
LLNSIGVKVDLVSPSDIDESPYKTEKPLKYVQRMALEKSKALEIVAAEYLLTADTIVSKGCRILGKPENIDQARDYLQILSGGRHRVLTSVCLTFEGIRTTKTVTTTVKFKRLSTEEIGYYLKSDQWRDKAGGYGIQGLASLFIPSINGSYTNVVGLPLTETAALLRGAGYKLAPGS